MPQPYRLLFAPVPVRRRLATLALPWPPRKLASPGVAVRVRVARPLPFELIYLALW